jgi:transcriptional regulator with XRE-family HTH domain
MDESQYDKGMARVALLKPTGRLEAMALRELRLARVLTQRELAVQAGISVKTLNGVEQFKVRPHPTTLRKLAAALGVEPTQLAEHLGDRPPPRPQPGARKRAPKPR